MRTLKEAIDLIAQESGEARFHNHMSGSMMPRGLDFWSISKTLEVVYGEEAAYDNILEEFVELEDHYFEEHRTAQFKAYEKEHGVKVAR